MASNGNSVSASHDRVRAAMRAYGQQKALALSIGVSESNLSKFIDGQLPVFLRLLDELGLELADRDEINELKRVLKRYL